MKEILVILNPYSGRGRGRSAVERVRAALNAQDVPFKLMLTERTGHGIELARAGRLNGYDTIVAAGGDGTVSEVVNGLAEAAGSIGTVGKLGILPIGSGNDFADMAGVSRNLAHAVRAIRAKEVRLVDLGRVTVTTDEGESVRYFNNNMGIGLEAEVTLESYKIRRLQGTLLYIVAALRALRRYSSSYLEISCRTQEGAEWRRAAETLLVTIGNTPRTGGGFYLTPNAMMSDGFLDVGIADALPVWRTLTLLPRALYGKHTTDSAITMLRVSAISVHCPAGVPIQLDGEVVARDARRIDVQVMAERLHLLVPAIP